MKVTEDDPRYEWPSRKQTKKTRKKNLLKTDPIEYARTFGVESVKQDVQRRTTAAVRRSVSTLGRKVASGAGIAAITGGTAALLTTSLAILAAGYVVMDRVAKTGSVTLGDRINTISQRFALLQSEIMKQYGTRDWNSVPQEVRNKAVSDYKRAIGTATAQGRGSASVTSRAEGSYK